VAKIAAARRVETSRIRVFAGIFETQNAAETPKIADFGIVLPSGVKE
jgi:hypothetical protein